MPGVRLSHRYLAGRQLPDKAVSILDTSCARLSLGQNATPPAIEDAMRQIDDLEVQQRILRRETAVGVDHSERLTEIEKQKADAQAHLATLRERWDKERDLVVQIRDIRTKLEGVADGDGHAAGVIAWPSPHVGWPRRGNRERRFRKAAMRWLPSQSHRPNSIPRNCEFSSPNWRSNLPCCKVRLA